MTISLSPSLVILLVVIGLANLIPLLIYLDYRRRQYRRLQQRRNSDEKLYMIEAAGDDDDDANFEVLKWWQKALGRRIGHRATGSSKL